MQTYLAHPTLPKQFSHSLQFPFQEIRRNFPVQNVSRLLHLIRKTAKPGLRFIKLTICLLETSLTKKQHNENKEPGEKRRKRN